MPDRAKQDQERPKDDEGGYGGGRERVEQAHGDGFGEQGWSSRTPLDRITTGKGNPSQNPRKKCAHTQNGAMCVCVCVCVRAAPYAADRIASSGLPPPVAARP